MHGRSCKTVVARHFSIVIFILACALSQANAQKNPNPCPNAKPVPAELRLPANLPKAGEPVEFEKQVLAYLSTLEYRKLGWCEDKWVRDTGPYMNQKDAIVHPPVRIFYSPEVSNWLLGDRNGDLHDQEFSQVARRLVLGRGLEQRNLSHEFCRPVPVSQCGIRAVLPSLPCVSGKGTHLCELDQHQGRAGMAAAIPG